jgi:pyrroline-5-carboxylate reductase
MGSAILQAVIASCRIDFDRGIEPRFTHFFACVQSEGSCDRLDARFNQSWPFVTVLRQQNVVAISKADVVLLGCKPYMIDAVLGEEGVRDALKGKLVISVLVGTPPAKLRAAMGVEEGHCYIVRAMPNTAAELRESMTVVENVKLPGDMAELTSWILNQLGETANLAPELYDAGGVLGGASGVFLSVALDGILDAAVSQGIKRPIARKIMAQSLIGLGKMLEAGHIPDELREKTSSPRGTTIEGLMALEEHRVRYAYTQATVRATKRSQTMS